MVDRFLGTRVPQEYFPSPSFRPDPGDVSQLYRGQIFPVDVRSRPEEPVLEQSLDERIESFVASFACSQTLAEATSLLMVIAGTYGSPTEQRNKRRAYRRLARLIHTDSLAGNEDIKEIERRNDLMGQVNIAYEIVNPKRPGSSALAA